MPQEPNKALRIAVPIALVFGGLLLGWAVLTNSSRTVPTEQTTTTDTARADDANDEIVDTPAAVREKVQPDAAPAPSSDTVDATPDEPAADTPAQAAATGIAGFRARPVEPAEFEPLGSFELDDGYEFRMTFGSHDAGIQQLALTRYYETIDGRVHQVIQEAAVTPAGTTVSSFGALQLEIEGVFVRLWAKPGEQFWEQTAPGEFVATVEDDPAGTPVARVTRRFVMEPGSFELRLRQSVENLTNRPLQMRWYQFGPIDLPAGTIAYGGDKRRIRFGYVLPHDQTQTVISKDGKPGLFERAKIMKGPVSVPVWPTAASQKYGYELCWTAMTGQYFALAVYSNTMGEDGTGDRRLPVLDTIDRFRIGDAAAKPADQHLILRFIGPNQRVKPGATIDTSMRVFAGPNSEKIINESPVARAVNMDRLVIYLMSSFCVMCTFQWVAYPLHGVLSFFHDYIVFDWGLSILLLVFCVRLVLHPITKFSQVRMFRFTKQMQRIAPKLQKMKEKFPDDPKKQQAEMQRLYREEGVNPANMLGCLPMFLQTPIWIALYAMIYFAFELRHEAAFFGVFQNFHGWNFLADLSKPDNFISFPPPKLLQNVPLFGTISSLNILPILLGVVFYLHQKYMTPETTASLTPEQESTQKMMKVLFTGMFPIFMYNAPSGLAIYFICNSTIAIFESKHIRKQAARIVEKEEELAKVRGPGGRPKKEPKAGGFMSRLSAALEERQREAQKQRSRQAKQMGPAAKAKGKSKDDGPKGKKRR